jgi:hypothetical protein
MKSKIIRVFAAICGVLLIGSLLIWQLREGLAHGERHTGLDLKITRDLLDSSVVGLDRFRSVYGHYPQTVGKYYFDSIKTFVSVSDVYVYADTITANGTPLEIRKPVGKHFDYLHARNTYLGAGRPEQTIIYRPLSLVSYKLYGVGENGLDEGGKGDDIEK